MAALPPADGAKLLALVSRSGGDTNARGALSVTATKLLALVSRSGSDTLRKDVRRFSHDRCGALMAHAPLRLPVLPGVANLSQARIGQTANHEDRGRDVITGWPWSAAPTIR